MRRAADVHVWANRLLCRTAQNRCDFCRGRLCRGHKRSLLFGSASWTLYPFSSVLGITYFNEPKANGPTETRSLYLPVEYTRVCCRTGGCSEGMCVFRISTTNEKMWWAYKAQKSFEVYIACSFSLPKKKYLCNDFKSEKKSTLCFPYCIYLWHTKSVLSFFCKVSCRNSIWNSRSTAEV